MSQKSGRQTPTGRSRKMLLQRHYRSTEAEDFLQLRQIIIDITQARENPHKRHDILMKAAEVIRQLDADYRLLLAGRLASASTSNTSSPMQQPASIHPVSYGPSERWSVNYDNPMFMHPYVANMSHTMYYCDAPASFDDIAPSHYTYFNQSG
ncbi:hypothetical protein EV424DRAFT_1391580 [Suillus variegatus]|nr:hypothetical protein EV424DRAFT_1391580 [Suillus variegatus]